jgi:TfoX/Sxy family transcriptional regulator of competence genes
MDEDAVRGSAGARPMAGSMPRPRPETTAWFRTLVPDDPRVTLRPMFGNLAAFGNGHMFAGLYGEDVYVRVPDDARAELVADGATTFAPMQRPMREYLVVPREWHQDEAQLLTWIARAMEGVLRRPPKEATPRRARARKVG